MFNLAQTVALTWIITLPNPEEKGWSTQLAEFDTTTAVEGSPIHKAMELSAARTVATLDASCTTSRGILISSHNIEHRDRMEALVRSLCEDNVCIQVI